MLSIYRASAGSGKTYTLARDYIRLLIGVQDMDSGTLYLNYDEKTRGLRVHNRHRHILAITFTRKATEEMKTRIISELDKISKLSVKSDYRAFFYKEYGWSQEAQAKVAEVAMRELLFDYHNFNVSTIDAFFQKVVHTFARELDRQSDYEVELSTENALKSAVADMLDEFNAANPANNPKARNLEEWIFGFMEDQMAMDKKANFFNRNSGAHTGLVKEMSNIEKESFSPYASQMRKYLQSGKLQAFVKDVDAYVKDALRNLAVKVRGELPCGLTDAMLATGIPCKLLSLLAEKGAAGGDCAFAASEVRTLIGWGLADKVMKVASGDLSRTFKKGKQPSDGEVATMQRLLDECMRVIVGSVHPLLKAQASLSFLGLLSYVWEYLDKSAAENNTLLISHTNTLVKQIIDNDDTPFIYERMGSRLDHFLIDEFQDTSAMQWSNLSPLVGNALASGCDSLVIGDEKQSIYRFRNSDASILHEKIGECFDEYIDKEEECSRTNINYRSADEIVLFNNDIFARLAEANAVDCYENVRQGLPDRKAPHHGYVRLAQTCTPENGAVDHRSQVLALMAEAILRQHHDRGYPWRKIAVLVNTNAEAKEVVAYLLEHYAGRIDVLSDEALLVSSSRAVRLVISALRIMDAMGTQPDEGNPRYLSEQKTKTLLQHYQYMLSQALIDMARKRDAADSEEVAAMAQRMMRKAIDEGGLDAIDEIKALQVQKPSSLVALVEFVIGKFLTPREREEQFAYLAALQDCVIDFCSSGRGSLHAFAEWWREHSSSLNITGAEESDAVRVMTIHKSKGLEFDCVHIPFCSWKMYGSKSSSLWVEPPVVEGFDSSNAPPALYLKMDKEFGHPYSPYCGAYTGENHAALTDTVNKTYVAFTRACSELYVWFYDGSDSEIGNRLARLLETSPLVRRSPVSAGGDGSDTVEIDVFEYGEPVAYEPGVAVASFKKGEKIVATYPVNPDERANAVLMVEDALDNEGNVADCPPEPSEADDGADDAIRRQGIELHAIMASIIRATDADRALSGAVVRLGLDADAAADYSAVVRGHIDQVCACGLKWYAGEAKSYIERPIVVPNMDLQRRPDRLVVYPDRSVDVIDYKFTPNSDHEGMDAHKDQVREYMRLMRDMNYDQVRGFLCYPRLGKIIEVKMNI